MSDFTRILNAVNEGETSALSELVPLVYTELRSLAAHKMASLQAGQTLQPTALVHEAWIRLSGLENPKFECRKHFFAAAAEAMRHILIDNARKKTAQRRGGGQHPVNLDNVDVASPGPSEELLALNDVLDDFAARWPAEAEVVKLRFFVGMTMEEIAEAMGISTRTADNYWAFARTWLFHEMNAKD